MRVFYSIVHSPLLAVLRYGNPQTAAVSGCVRCMPRVSSYAPIYSTPGAAPSALVYRCETVVCVGGGVGLVLSAIAVGITSSDYRSRMGKGCKGVNRPAFPWSTPHNGVTMGVQ